MTAMTTLRLLGLLAAVAGILFLALSCGGANRRAPSAPADSARPTRSEATRTDATPFVAWLEGHRLSLPLYGRLAGECFAPSIAAWERSDAWRCAASGEIHDPCFSDPAIVPAVGAQPTDVACPRFVTPPAGGPAQPRDIVVVEGPNPLPPSTGPALPPPTGRPWAVQLGDGTWCTSATGTVDERDGTSTSYQCFDGTALYGDIDRTTTPWTALRRRDGNGGGSAVELVRAFT